MHTFNTLLPALGDDLGDLGLFLRPLLQLWEIDERERVDAYVRRDDELQPGEANTVAWYPSTASTPHSVITIGRP